VLGVLVITSEYSTGSIQTSLAAVPRRGRFLAAKATVLTAVSLITGEATALTVFLLGQALISGQAPTAAFGQPGVLRAVLGSGRYLAALGLLGVALGTLLRHPAAAIGVLVAGVRRVTEGTDRHGRRQPMSMGWLRLITRQNQWQSVCVDQAGRSGP
jgi:ABC-2 type transport system permease protein